MSATPYQLRARVASLSRSRLNSDPELVNARQDLAATNLEQYIESVVRTAPPLRAEQRDRLVALLVGSAA